jgi:hypothetical protein
MDLSPAAPAGPRARPEPTWEPTPSIGGYLLAAVIAVVLGSVLIAEIVMVVTENAFTLSGFLGSSGVIAVVAAIAALVLGGPLTVLAHFQLRSVRPQWVHIAAFGAVGAVVGLVTTALLLAKLYSVGVDALIVGAVAVAAAVGRLCVSGHRWRESFPFPFDR